MAKPCKWCTSSTCLICQLGEDGAVGASSAMGRLADYLTLMDHTVESSYNAEDYEVHSQSLAPPCPVCGKRYADLFLHYRKTHPEISAPIFSKKVSNARKHRINP